MRNARLAESQVGSKTSERNINNLRYADDTTLMVEGEEESEKVGLKLNIQKTKIMASGPITLWQIDAETMETVTDFILLGSKITVASDCSHETKSLAPSKQSYSNTYSVLKSRDISLPNKSKLWFFQ